MNQVKKVMKVFTTCMAMIMLFAACGTTGATEGSKELNLAETDPSNNLNSLTTAEAVNFRIIRNMQEGLFRKNLANESEEAMAEDWSVDDTGTVYTFNIRQNATWSNGDPVTAHDFVFAWQKVATLGDSSYKNYTDLIKNGSALTNGKVSLSEFGAKAISDDVLEVTLEGPVAYFIDLLSASTMAPVNEAFYHSVGGDNNYGTTAETVISNGAYILTEYDSASGYTLTRNAGYWDVKNVDIATVNVRVIQSLDTQGVMWDNGDLDKLSLSGDLVEKYDGDPLLEAQKEARTGYIYLSGTTSTPNDVLANKNFRAAVAHAIDKTVLAETILKDGSIPSDYLIPADFVKNDGQDFREYANQYNEVYFSVTKAQTYLAEAKKELGDTKLEFVMNCPDVQPTKKMMESIVAQINENLPDVHVTLQTHPRQTYYNTLFEHGTPAGYSGWGAEIQDPFSFVELFVDGTSFNFPVYQSVDYNKYVQESASAESMLDQNKRWDAFVNAEKTLIDDYVVIPIFQKGSKILVRDNVKNFTGTSNQPVSDYRLITKG